MKIKLGASCHGVLSWWLLSVSPPGHSAHPECSVCVREGDTTREWVLLGVWSVVVLSRGWKGCFPQGMWWYQPCYPSLGWALGTGWAGEGHGLPQYGTISCGPHAMGRDTISAHIAPHLHYPPARPGVPPQPDSCLLPQLSSGTPGLWFQGAQLTSPHRQWPGTAVTSSPLSQESHLPARTPLHGAWQDLDLQGRQHFPG